MHPSPVPPAKPQKMPRHRWGGGELPEAAFGARGMAFMPLERQVRLHYSWGAPTLYFRFESFRPQRLSSVTNLMELLFLPTNIASFTCFTKTQQYPLPLQWGFQDTEKISSSSYSSTAKKYETVTTSPVFPGHCHKLHKQSSMWFVHQLSAREGKAVISKRLLVEGIRLKKDTWFEEG